MPAANHVAPGRPGGRRSEKIKKIWCEHLRAFENVFISLLGGATPVGYAVFKGGPQTENCFCFFTMPAAWRSQTAHRRLRNPVWDTRRRIKRAGRLTAPRQTHL